MSLLEPSPALTLQDYLAIEERTGVRHEWVNGAAYAMSGGSAEHSAIKTNLTGAMVARLKGGPCRAADSDQRVHVLATGSSFYADLVVVCGQYAFASEDPQAVTNPTVLVEVLSGSTEDYDRATDYRDSSPSGRRRSLRSLPRLRRGWTSASAAPLGRVQHYRRIDTLRAYVLVSQDEQRVEIRERVEGGWLVREVLEGELAIPSLGVSVPFEELYDVSGIRDGVIPKAT